ERSPESRQARSMARELSQEAVLDFLWAAGGRAPNTALLRHFQSFLRDPALTEQQRRERREYFKSLVNSLATVHPGAAPGASKDIVLRRRYRDLLDEELPPERQEEEEKEPPPRRDPNRRRGPPGKAAENGQPGGCQPSGPPLPLSRQPHPSRPPPSLSLQPQPLRPSPSQSPPQFPTWPPPSQSLQPHPSRPPPSQSPPQSPTLPPPSHSLQPPPARPPPPQSLLPAQCPTGLQTPESSPPAPLPVFRSIRCQLALQEVRDVTSLLPDDCGRQPRTMLTKSYSRNVTSRGLSVPLGQREHAWLVAVSAGRWAQVRALFLEEPELALQRDFISGFTVLHWLAKHGDGPGLQELAAAARQAGLTLDVDARSGCGYTPLHLAAIHGHQLVIRVLVLQLGCQVQVRDSSGRQPWEYLGSSTSGEIWQLLEAP
ncbi:SWAHB protein, partial [Pedionomus torquatus]|nr:SWAHB protein [Pedionomus torquatus]